MHQSIICGSNNLDHCKWPQVPLHTCALIDAVKNQKYFFNWFNTLQFVPIHLFFSSLHKNSDFLETMNLIDFKKFVYPGIVPLGPRLFWKVQVSKYHKVFVRTPCGWHKPEMIQSKHVLFSASILKIFCRNQE